jgi:hypothetical protein
LKRNAIDAPFLVLRGKSRTEILNVSLARGGSTPFRLARRRDVHISGKKVALGLERPHCDKQVGPITFMTWNDCHLGSDYLAVPPYPIGNCLVAHDGWKCDKPRKDFFNSHGAALPAQFAGYRHRNRKQ